MFERAAKAAGMTVEAFAKSRIFAPPQTAEDEAAADKADLGATHPRGS